LFLSNLEDHDPKVIQPLKPNKVAHHHDSALLQADTNSSSDCK